MSARCLAVCLVLAAGCAGDDGRSKDGFIADADALCGAASAQLAGLGPLRPALFEASEQRRGLERWFSGFVQTLGDNVAELRALERPEGEEGALGSALFGPRERVLSHASETLALVRANGTPVASSRGDELRAKIAAARAPAIDYGFEHCAEIG